MTEPLYLDDPTLVEFSATVDTVEEEGVVLDRTAFYPTGGGQPHDVGTLETDGETAAVTDVRGRSAILHIVDSDELAEGMRVTGRVDWERRYGHMRYHTAQHLLSAVLVDRYGAPTAGNQLYADRARIDCEYDRFTDDELAVIEAEVNDHIEADRPVRWWSMDRAEAEEQLDPVRTRLDLLPASIETVRIVQIDGVDRTACAGTHVERTGELGQFELLGRETGGRGRERLRFRLHRSA